MNVSLPKKTRNNGTLFAIIFVHQSGINPWQDPRKVHLVAHLTTYMVPKPPEISLISREDQTTVIPLSTMEISQCFCGCVPLVHLLFLLWSRRVRQKKLRRRNGVTLTPPLRVAPDPSPHQITRCPTGAHAWRSTSSATTSFLTETTCLLTSTDTSECEKTRVHASPGQQSGE